MPAAPMRPCSLPGCGTLVRSGRCAMHQHRRATAAQRGYGADWQAYRQRYLRAHPWCVFHMERGVRVKASVVDHIVPHRGDKALFWDPANHQPLCAACHNSTKQRMEKRGEAPRSVPVMRGGEPSHQAKSV